MHRDQDSLTDFDAQWLKRRGITQWCAIFGIRILYFQIWPLLALRNVKMAKNGQFQAILLKNKSLSIYENTKTVDLKI